jgi:hypothetical protein
MIGIVCEGLSPQSPLGQWVHSRQDRFQLQSWTATPDDIRMKYREDLAEAPWRLRRAGNLVEVSTWRCSALARYAGRSRREYLLLTGMLALTQFRALALNPLLKPTDFIHRCEESCLFVYEPNRAFERFLLATDQLRICRGCSDFYHCLGVDPEWFALNAILKAFHEQRLLVETA